MKKLTLAATVALLAAPAVQADTLLGLYAGVGSWQSDYSGNVGEPSIDLQELGFKKQDNTYFYIALEHPIPLLPNIRLDKVDISSSQAATINKTFEIDGTTFIANDKVSSDFDLSHIDATLYYEILDNWVNLDLGLTARKFDGYVYASSVLSGNKRVAIDQTLPLLYVKAQFDLPFTGLSAGGDAKYVSFDGDKISDYSLKLSYMFDSALDIGVEAGYRKMSLTVDDSDLQAKVDLDGPYAAFIAHF